MNIPSEKFTEKDATMLIKQYARTDPQKVNQLREQLLQQKGKFFEKERAKQKYRSR